MFSGYHGRICIIASILIIILPLNLSTTAIDLGKNVIEPNGKHKIDLGDYHFSFDVQPTLCGNENPCTFKEFKMSSDEIYGNLVLKKNIERMIDKEPYDTIRIRITEFDNQDEEKNPMALNDSIYHSICDISGATYQKTYDNYSIGGYLGEMGYGTLYGKQGINDLVVCSAQYYLPIHTRSNGTVKCEIISILPKTECENLFHSFRFI